MAGSEAASGLAEGPRTLGVDPATGLPVTLRRGPYGFYVQLGETETDARGRAIKPKRVSLLPGMDPDGADARSAPSPC